MAENTDYTEETALFSGPKKTASVRQPSLSSNEESLHTDTNSYQHSDTRHSQNAPGESTTQGPDEIPEPCAIPPFDAMLGSVHEKAMEEAGFGKLQWLLFVVLGLGLMGDGIELLMIAYILPGAEKDLCMDDRMKGWLGRSLTGDAACCSSHLGQIQCLLVVIPASQY